MITVLRLRRYLIAVLAVLAATTAGAIINGQGTNARGAPFRARTTAYVSKSPVKLPPPETPAVMRAEAKLARPALSP